MKRPFRIAANRRSVPASSRTSARRPRRILSHRPTLEGLESRVLLAADVGAAIAEKYQIGDLNGDGVVTLTDATLHLQAQAAGTTFRPNIFHNYFNATDVDNNGQTSIKDVLEVVMELRTGGIRALPLASDGEGEGGNLPSARVDVNNDALLSMTDALQVVQALRAEGAPGDQKVQFRTEITPNSELNNAQPSQSTLTQAGFGDEFLVRVFVQDIRDYIAAADRGVAAFYVDTTYNENLVSFDPRVGATVSDPLGRNIVFGPQFDGAFVDAGSARNPGSTPGELSEVGALWESFFQNPGPNEFLAFTAEFKVGAGDDRFTVIEDSTNNVLDVLANDARQSGTATFLNNPADDPGKDVLLFNPSGNDTVSQRERLATDDEQVFVGSSIQVSISGPVTIQSVDDPANGTASIVNNQVVYTPDPGFTGTDVFTYTIVNNGVTDVGRVTVTVEPGVVPRASNDTFTVVEDSANNVLNPLGNDRLRPASEATTTIIGLGPSNLQTINTPSGGTVTIVQNGTRISYTPANNFFGTETFTYTIDDDFTGGPSDPSTATITINVTNVNDPPVANPDQYSTNDDTVLVRNAAQGVLANDSDPDNDVVPGTDTLTVSAFQATSDQGATVAVNPDGSFSYDPRTSAALSAMRPGDSAVDTFTYTVSDGKGGTAQTTVTINVSGINSRPRAGAVTGATNEDTVLTAAAPGVRQGATDPDSNDALIEAVPASVTSAQGAAVVINADGSYSYDPRSAAALQALSQGQTVQDTFTFSLRDDEGATGTGTATITVTGVNDQPVANDDNYTTDENTAITRNVLANDTDIDANDVLTVASVQPTSQLGAAVSIAANGQVTYDPSVSQQLQSLREGQTVVDTFTYTISDGRGGSDTATVTVTVTGVNDAVQAVDDNFATNEDTVLSGVNVTANDNPGDEGKPVSVTQFDAVSQRGATVSITPAGALTYDPRSAAALQALKAGETITDTFRYTFSDGTTNSQATVTVTVTGVNDAPVAQNDGPFTVLGVEGQRSLDVLANDTDIDGDPLTIINVTPATSAGGSTMAIGPNGKTLIYTPSSTFEGTETFTYTISDGQGGTDTATVTINLTQFIPSTISGFVFLDANNNGARDAGEEGLAGAAVTISGNSIAGPVNQTVLTDRSGRYVFSNLAPTAAGSQYTISLQSPNFMIEPTLANGSVTNANGGPVAPGAFSATPADVDGDGDSDVFRVTIAREGNVSATMNFVTRGLSPQYISVFDILASSGNRTEVGLASTLANGSSNYSLPPTGNGWQHYSAIRVIPQNSDGTLVRIEGIRASDGGSVLSPVINVNTHTGIRIIGTDAQGNKLYRIQGAASDFGMPSGGGGGEGENPDDVIVVASSTAEAAPSSIDSSVAWTNSSPTQSINSLAVASQPLFVGGSLTSVSTASLDSSAPLSGGGFSSGIGGDFVRSSFAVSSEFSAPPSANGWQAFSAIRIVSSGDDSGLVRIEAIRLSDGETVQSEEIDVEAHGKIRRAAGAEDGVYLIEGTPADFGLEGEGDSEATDEAEDYAATVDALFESGEWSRL